MSNKTKIEIKTTDDDLSAIDDELDAAVEGLVGVNQRIAELLETIEAPEPGEGDEGEGPETGGDAAAQNQGEVAGDATQQQQDEQVAAKPQD